MSSRNNHDVWLSWALPRSRPAVSLIWARRVAPMSGAITEPVSVMINPSDDRP